MLPSYVFKNTLATVAQGYPDCMQLKHVTVLFWKAQHYIQPPSLAAVEEFQHTHRLVRGWWGHLKAAVAARWCYPRPQLRISLGNYVLGPSTPGVEDRHQEQSFNDWQRAHRLPKRGARLGFRGGCFLFGLFLFLKWCTSFPAHKTTALPLPHRRQTIERQICSDAERYWWVCLLREHSITWRLDAGDRTAKTLQ